MYNIKQVQVLLHMCTTASIKSEAAQTYLANNWDYIFIFDL